MRNVVSGGDVSKVCVTPSRLFVPSEHRADCLAQLSCVGIVDTAGVDPLIVEAILGSLGAAAVQSFLSWANLPVGFDLNILRP